MHFVAGDSAISDAYVHDWALAGLHARPLLMQAVRLGSTQRSGPDDNGQNSKAF